MSKCKHHWTQITVWSAMWRQCIYCEVTHKKIWRDGDPHSPSPAKAVGRWGRWQAGDPSYKPFDNPSWLATDLKRQARKLLERRWKRRMDKVID